MTPTRLRTETIVGNYSTITTDQILDGNFHSCRPSLNHVPVFGDSNNLIPVPNTSTGISEAQAQQPGIPQLVPPHMKGLYNKL